MPRLKDFYHEQATPTLQRELAYDNVMQVPRLDKIVVNIGLGEALQNAKALERATGDMMIITGQRPVITRAKKSIATFRLREGNPVGAKVTLRGNRMWDFLDRLLNISLARQRSQGGRRLASEPCKSVSSSSATSSAMA